MPGKTKTFEGANETENIRAAELFHKHQFDVYRRTDRIFAFLLPIQWLAGIAASYFISPLTWSGEQSSFHPHFWFAVLIGGAITSLPTYFTIAHPGATLTRHLVAVGQMLMSGLLIHITGGRIETHFHVFGSLAFLACYRDWRVLIPATVVTALDHILRGWLYPYSIYGILTGAEWRWVEHAGWVIFTDVFLIISCLRSVREMREIALRAASLNTSEERYRAVVEQTTDGIVLIEPESLRVIECNEAFCRLIGCHSVAEAKTLTAFDFSTASHEELAKLSHLVIEEKTTVKGERTYRRRDGSLIQVDINANLITYNGKHAFCLGVKDITERKQIEQKNQDLIKELADFKFALDESSIVAITDQKGKINYVNDKFCEISKYSRQELIGQDHRIINSGYHPKEFIRELWTTIANGKIWRGEIKNRAKDDSFYWVDTTIVPLLNVEGTPQQYVAIRYDITERKNAEQEVLQMNEKLEHRIIERTAELVQANESMQTEVNERQRAEIELKETQQFMHTVIDNVPSLIFVKDIEGNFVLVNQALADIFGTTPAELIGKTDADFSHNPEEAQKFTEEDIKTLENLEERFIPEEKHTDVHGNLHWYQTVKRSVLLKENGARYLVGVATDFTERKIMESQLRHSQKMESIGQLAAGIAHEINTPTQYVGDNARFVRDAFNDISLLLKKFEELLDSAKKNEVNPELISEVEKEIDDVDLEYLVEEVPNALQQSLDGVSRIAKIVQSMKEFAHPGASEKKAADLNRAIESTITVARNEWKYVADLETHFDQNLPPVPCFLGEFNQVVLNMVINAAHAITDVVGDGSQGKGKITITTTKVNDDWAEVRIGDSGSGIPPEAQGRIFDPFFTTKEVGKGTGQGLAISHTVVVEKHNGQLSFETEPGQGTTFIIRLPLQSNGNSNQNGNLEL